MESENQNLIIKHILLIGGIILLFYCGCKGRENLKPWAPSESKKATVVVYGKQPEVYRRHCARIVVEDIETHKRFTINDYYIEEPRQGVWHYHKNLDVSLAERGDTLNVQSQSRNTWQVLQNLTAERIVRSGR